MFQDFIFPLHLCVLMNPNEHFFTIAICFYSFIYFTFHNHCDRDSEAVKQVVKPGFIGMVLLCSLVVSRESACLAASAYMQFVASGSGVEC